MAIKKDNTDGRPHADRAGLCWRTFSRNQRGALRVELRSGRIFILPYMHWGHAHLEKVKGVEELTIHFNSHEVRVEGRNLKELLLELQAANVELLREIPEQFLPITNGAIIHNIRVSDGTVHQPV
jgi:hypothetical protein